MTERHGATTQERSNILSRHAVIAQIEARLTSQLDDAALATWAFDHFYAQELGQEQYEVGAESAIADSLDALMFGDDPGFQLSEEELRALVARLASL